MKIIDSRSGQALAVGQTVVHPDGESVTLLEVRPGLFRARARMSVTSRDVTKISDSMVGSDGIIDISGLPLVTREQWVPLVVRWLHPAFPLQHVAFVPS